MNKPAVWEEDHDKPFVSKSHNRAGGNLQALNFSINVINRILKAPQIVDALSAAMYEDGKEEVCEYRIHDYGCAEGDGTAVWAVTFPASTVVGFDISKEAIKRAKDRWPTMNFRQGDITAPQEHANIIYTSHTIEHLEDPANCINNLLNFCNLLIVVVPPVNAEENGGHTGAVFTDKWVTELKKKPWCISYNTCRWNVEQEMLMMEGNYLFVFRGNSQEL